jgi:septin family protein
MFTELELDEEGTRISLDIVDTPGFGDQIDNEARYAPTTRPIHGSCFAKLLRLQLLGDRRLPRETI